MGSLIDETSSLQQFKEAVQDLNQNDGVLIRFLRARDYDLYAAEKMLRNAVQWRKKIGLEDNSYLKWSFPPHYHSNLEYRYFGRDYEGAPICWLFTGKWAAKEMMEKEDSEQNKRFIYKLLEEGLQETIECGSPGNVVMDFEGFSYTQATDMATLKFAYYSLQTLEQYYPETIKAMYMINVPWIFSFTFNFVKGVFAQRTLEKTKIFSCKEDWQAEFLKRFPRESIVPELQLPF